MGHRGKGEGGGVFLGENKIPLYTIQPQHQSTAHHYATDQPPLTRHLIVVGGPIQVPVEKRMLLTFHFLRLGTMVCLQSLDLYLLWELGHHKCLLKSSKIVQNARILLNTTQLRTLCTVFKTNLNPFCFCRKIDFWMIFQLRR